MRLDDLVVPREVTKQGAALELSKKAGRLGHLINILTPEAALSDHGGFDHVRKCGNLRCLHRNHRRSRHRHLSSCDRLPFSILDGPSADVRDIARHLFPRKKLLPGNRENFEPAFLHEFIDRCARDAAQTRSFRLGDQIIEVIHCPLSSL
jgi:hypothetical protein